MYKIIIKDQIHYIENEDNAKLIAINHIIDCLNEHKMSYSVELFNLVQNRKYNDAIRLFNIENATTGRAHTFSFTKTVLNYMKIGTLTYYNKLNKENVFK